MLGPSAPDRPVPAPTRTEQAFHSVAWDSWSAGYAGGGLMVFLAIGYSRKTKQLSGSPNFRDSADAVVVLLIGHVLNLAALGSCYLDPACAYEMFDVDFVIWEHIRLSMVRGFRQNDELIGAGFEVHFP